MLEARTQHAEAPSGLAALPTLPWGSHVGHLFESADELRNVLVPYFKAGLENQERCLWVTGAPLDALAAREALRKVCPDLENREACGQIEIVDGSAFYDASKPLPIEQLVTGLVDRADKAIAGGFNGLRTNGNCGWVGQQQWSDFQRYEALVHENIRGRRMICMCSYHSQKAADVIDVVDRHHLVLRPPSRRKKASAAAQDLQLRTESSVRSSNDLPTMDDWLQVDQAVLDSLPIGFYCCDALGQIARANRRAIDLWGQPVQWMDTTARFCGSFRIENLDGKLLPPEESPVARAVLYGETFEGIKAIVKNPDGKEWVARMQVAPLHDDVGRVVGAINCFDDVTREHATELALARQQRTFDLAMVASKMGTWRYTMADNICIYDENAQRLYGLKEARFLHDEQGVRDKFHPDDLDSMWSRVARAIDPQGDGHYDVEYRVKQLDGSWRWLSAWGSVEFEGEGSNRRAVAISGATRDLSEIKKAEDLQRLLANELEHRIKNTLSIVQAIIAFTLHGATDLRSAGEKISERIISLGRAHDLLTTRNWLGAGLHDLVYRVLGPFNLDQFDIAGPPVEVAPNHALALSLGLHELATNSAKYGALSVREGRVHVHWVPTSNHLAVSWRESGGPRVTHPTRRGFGSRLLEEVLARDLGATRLEYFPEGLRCEFTVVENKVDIRCDETAFGRG